MSVPIQPLASYVVAEQEEAASKTASGLYLPDNAKEKPHVAKVLAVGADIKDIKAGDRIIYGGYTNETIKYEAKEYILIKSENIFATVK